MGNLVRGECLNLCNVPGTVVVSSEALLWQGVLGERQRSHLEVSKTLLKWGTPLKARNGSSQ